MGAHLMCYYDVPWRTFVFPAYRAALKAKRKSRSVGGDGE